MAFRVTDLIVRLRLDEECNCETQGTCNGTCDCTGGGGCDTVSIDCVESNCPGKSAMKTPPPGKENTQRTLAMLKAQLRDEIARESAGAP